MIAHKDDGEHAAPSHYQIVMRLQALRARVHDGLPETTDLLAGILGVAIAARTGDLTGFTSVCMLVYERIESRSRAGRLPRSMLELIAEWSANSELYLRRPQYVEFARALVQQLTESQWGSRLDHAEQDRLIRALLECSS